MSRFLRGTPLILCLALISPGGGAGKPPSFPKEETCSGDFGTSIQFLDTPQEASQEAKKDGRLVLVLHVSGHFEKPEFT